MRGLITVLFLLGLAVVSTSAYESTVVVGKLTLTHSGNLSAENEKLIQQEIKSHQYKSNAATEIAERVRYVYQRLGYFKVFVHDPVITVVSASTQPQTVEVTVDVDQGEIYRLKNIAFSKTSVFADPELRGQFHIADGDIFNRDKIAEGLEGLRNLYVGKGYNNFSAVPKTEVVESDHTIALVVDLDEGARQQASNR